MSYETVIVDVADHVATITINRPEALNSFTRTMMEEFRQLWHEISWNDDIHVSVVRAAPGRADWILQITNDAWFGNLTGPFQHAALARLRAIEQGLPLVRVGNTGVTAVYDARGRVTASLPFQTEGALDAALPGALPATPYARAGEWPVLVLLAGLALGLAVAGRRKAA